MRATEYNVNSPGDVFSDVFVSVAAMMTEWSYGADWVVVVCVFGDSGEGV